MARNLSMACHAWPFASAGWCKKHQAPKCKEIMLIFESGSRGDLSVTLRIGTSGWVYNHWRGVFYPQTLPQGDWFRHYALTFDTVEINNSFYRLPTGEVFESWREQAPRSFVYAVKASRFLTHMKKLKDPDEPIARFFKNASKLGRALGPVLYQLPPRWRVNLERFEYFLNVLPKKYEHVIEFRDASWLVEDTFRLMER